MGRENPFVDHYSYSSGHYNYRLWKRKTKSHPCPIISQIQFDVVDKNDQSSQREEVLHYYGKKIFIDGSLSGWGTMLHRDNLFRNLWSSITLQFLFLFGTVKKME